jgi:hypothetical protein
VVILGLVVVIAGAVVVRGECKKEQLWGGWDESRYIPPTSGEAGGEAASMASAPKASEPASTSPGSASTAPAATGASALLTPDLAGPDWSAGKRESFPADRLWEKIDGGVEKFLQYDVVSLEAMTYQSRQDKNLTLDLHIYNMGQPLTAFGIYSSERPLPLEHPVDVGREGYESGGIYFWQGPYYNMIIPSNPDQPGVSETMLKIARQLAEQQTDDKSSLWGETALPAKGQIPHSLKYLHQDALGVDFMPGVYTAQYGRVDSPIEVFLTDRGSPQKAQEVFDRYVQSLGESGKVSAPRPEGEATVVVCDMGGIYDFAFRQGSLIGGVKAAPDKAAGEAQLKSLLEGLETEKAG